MKLVLAEKPSAAQSFAKVQGATKREDGYLHLADTYVDGPVKIGLNQENPNSKGVAPI